MVRLLVCIPLGLGVAALLFWLLAHLAGFAAISQHAKSAPVRFQFLAIKQDTQAQILQREREKPPEPELEQAPQMPNMQQPAAAPVMAPQLNLAMPQLEASTVQTVAVDIGKFAPPAPMGLMVDNQAMPVARVNPTYPSKARRRNIEGEVTVEFEVGKDGSVVASSIKIVAANPADVFDKSVRRAVARWRYQPKQVNGQNVAFKTRTILQFNMLD
ncbi:energy transducer TonB [Motilimonas pumila]|uniref:Protein TonB n=1 Tax=Motilimonas pumila TaxID=2303987 RepID=A0A418YEI2_9GAMM|nr:energy transducer TonB [Motilimonas pumila]RJG47506.1 energy transducer TonB [Motilimonas pumila]